MFFVLDFIYLFTCGESNHTKILYSFLVSSASVWNIFYSIIIQVTENNIIFTLQESSIEKTPPAKIEIFLMTLFNLNHSGKIVFWKKCSILNFNTHMRFALKLWKKIAFRKNCNFEEGIEDLKGIIILMFAGDWGELQEKLLLRQSKWVLGSVSTHFWDFSIIS